MIRFLQGDCRDVLRDLRADSVHCVVTSPPYYGLRDYGVPPSIWGGDRACDHEWGDESTSKASSPPSPKSGLLGNGDVGGGPKAQAAKAGIISRGSFCTRCDAWRGCLGHEPTPERFVQHLVEVFREVRRVLRPDGILWMNLGDTYASNGGSGAQGSRGERYDRRHTQEYLGNVRKWPGSGIKAKDLIGIPWMAAFALRSDGWYLRRDQIWHKQSCMPEAVKDRPTTAHEYAFLLTKSGDYFFDSEAIAEEPTGNAHPRGSGKHPKSRGGAAGSKQNESYSESITDVVASRSPRSVWTISPTPFKGSHFATMPTGLAEKCIKSGTSEVGCCPHCGAPWERLVTKGRVDQEWQRACGGDTGGAYHGVSTKGHAEAGVQDASEVKKRILAGMREKITAGWVMTCSCPIARPVPCIVMDPFGGAGTTGIVADRLRRDAVSIELKPDYIAMAVGRYQGDARLFAEVAHA